MDDDGLGLAIGAVLVFGFAAVVLTIAFYVLVAVGAVALVGGTVYLIGRLLWQVGSYIYECCQPTAEELIERDYESTKAAMNDVAGHSWRNMAG